MTTVRWMLLGLLLGFSVSSALSCGGAKPCGPKECPFGCCDATGACQPGSSSSQCGAQGTACTACALAQQCNLGICGNFGTSGGPGGGSGGGSGGGTGGGSLGGGTGGGSTGGGVGGGGGVACGPSNCAGCCRTGVCVTSPNNANNTTCGASGSSCVDCSALAMTCNTATHACTTGTGGGTGGGGGTCDGCRLPSSTCVPLASTSVVNCGRLGATCVACQGGQLCTSGVCVTPPTGGGGGTGGGVGGGGGAVGGGTGGAGGGFAGGETCATPVILPGPGAYSDTTANSSDDYGYITTTTSGTLCQAGSTSSSGPDKVYRVTVPANSTLDVDVTQDFIDATVNLINASSAANCGGSATSGLIPVCLAGADDPAHVTWTNTLGTSTQVLILVDGYSSSSAGAYTLTYTITP